MKFNFKKITEIRKLKGLTQEDLAIQSQVNLRTIQRIENNESQPRGKTLALICEVLNIDIKELEVTDEKGRMTQIFTKIMDIFFLLLLNLGLMLTTGYLTLSVFANQNSRFGGLLLSVFIPIFIVFLTRKMNGLERTLKFGFGYVVYFFMLLVIHGLIKGFVIGISTWLFPCLLISILVLYFGNWIVKVLLKES